MKSKKPEISIVIPTYNHCDDLLKPCLQSIINYTDMTNVEVLVVANGCTDGTKEYVEELGGSFKLLWEEQKLGYTKATNIGIKASVGKYVILLNNDTILLPQKQNCWIDLLKAPFLSDDNVAISGPLELCNSMTMHTFLVFFCVMIRSKIFDQVGYLDEVFSPGGGEDVDFCIRCQKYGYKIVSCGGTTLINEQHVGDFPIFHIGEGTLNIKEHPEYSKHIFKKNALTNFIRYAPHIRLSLGSASTLPGYINVAEDEKAAIEMDICHLDFGDNTIDELLVPHLFQQLNPHCVIKVLQEWYRVLKPKGKLVMEMSNILEICNDFIIADKHRRYGLLNEIFGETKSNMYGWYPDTLIEHLNAAGFTEVIFSSPLIKKSGHNLRVECIKP